MSPLINLDCFRPNTGTGDATISIKLSCCSKKIKRKLSIEDINTLKLVLEHHDDDVINEIFKKVINEVNSNKIIVSSV